MYVCMYICMHVCMFTICMHVVYVDTSLLSLKTSWALSTCLTGKSFRYDPFDTVLLATTREECRHKVRILYEFCQRSGMEMNQTKTKFMCIIGTPADRVALSLESATTENCDTYWYLGTIFKEDGKCESSVREQIKSKQAQIMKFVSFVIKNKDFPFTIKRKVMEAALLSSILYASESWIGTSIDVANNAYMTVIKCCSVCAYQPEMARV